MVGGGLHFFLYKIGRAVANGGCGGVTPPLKTSCRQTKNNIPQNVKLYSLHSRAILAHNKEKWDKFCQFCEKLCYFVISGKFVLCLEKIWYVRKIFGPLKWYTDRNFFGDGGGGRSSKIIFFKKKL